MQKFLVSVLILIILAGVFGWLFLREPSPEDKLVFEGAPPMAPSEPIIDRPAEETPPPKPEPIPESLSVEKVLHTVPFTVQAPTGEWGNTVFQDACEEASVLMAAAWLSDETFTTESARKKIVAMTSWQTQKIGHSIDTDAADTQELLLEEYLEITGTELIYDFTLRDLQLALQKGIVIVPTNGQKLGNPNFTSPGPLQHMLVVIGYDPVTKEFITNDPGTRAGKNYRYAENVLFAAIRDYPTGKHLPIKTERKAMIIIAKNDAP